MNVRVPDDITRIENPLPSPFWYCLLLGFRLLINLSVNMDIAFSFTPTLHQLYTKQIGCKRIIMNYYDGINRVKYMRCQGNI